MKINEKVFEELSEMNSVKNRLEDVLELMDKIMSLDF